MYIADFSKDHSAIGITDTRNGRDNGIFEAHIVRMS